MGNVLVIDDDKSICKLVETALTRDGHKVIWRTTAKNLTLNEFKNIDILLLDIMMPDIDGLSFCRKNRDFIDCPILFLSAKSLEQDVLTGFMVGGDDYIKKPFSIVELRARVNAHIRREHRQRHHSLLLGNCCFDLSEKQITFDNRLLHLTKSEYEICELLATNRGQTFSLERILEKTLGYDSESDITSIRVHVNNIRNKFKDKNDCPIETVWGVGYRWK